MTSRRFTRSSLQSSAAADDGSTRGLMQDDDDAANGNTTTPRNSISNHESQNHFFSLAQQQGETEEGVSGSHQLQHNDNTMSDVQLDYFQNGDGANNIMSSSSSSPSSSYPSGEDTNDEVDDATSHRMAALRTQISSLESQIRNVNTSTSQLNTATTISLIHQIEQSNDEMSMYISEMECELLIRRERTDRMRRLILDYIKLPEGSVPTVNVGSDMMMDTNSIITFTPSPPPLVFTKIILDTVRVISSSSSVAVASEESGMDEEDDEVSSDESR